MCPYKCKDLTVKVKLPAIQIVTVLDAGTLPVAADIGGTVTIGANKVAIGKLLGFKEVAAPADDIWYVETTVTVPASTAIAVRGGTGTGTTVASPSVAGVQKYLELDNYTDCVASDIGKIVTDDGADVGPLVDFDNDGQRWMIAGESGTIADDSNMAITGGTGTGKANGNSFESVDLAVVEGMSIELMYEGGMEYLFGREKEVGIGPKHATFTVRRWFYAADTNKDILFDLFNDKVYFDLEGAISGQPNATIRIRKCKALRWRPILGTANDTIAEEIVGEAEDWIKSTPTD